MFDKSELERLKKQYLVFAGRKYYPEGGIKDVVFSSEFKTACELWINGEKEESFFDWYVLYDQYSQEVIYEFEVDND